MLLVAVCFHGRPAMLYRCCHTFLQCDVTAVGATMCRHSIVAHLLDIGTGERYIYAAIMLYTLMVRW